MTEQDAGIREIRINPIVPTESVLIATARSMRPKQTEEGYQADKREHVETCPFCRGNEDRTPPAIVTHPDNKDWEMRIVENLFPVLADTDSQPNFTFGLQQTIDGYGRHEVVIDHNQHGIAVHEMSVEHLGQLFVMYQQRITKLYESDDRLRYVLLFKNYGPAAGGSIPHTHSQIIAMPVVPQNVEAEVTNSHEYYQKQHHCIFCTLIDEALSYEATIYDKRSGEVRRKINVGQYVVERGEHFVAIKPFASRYEWEVHILPLEHLADFPSANPDHLVDFARVLKNTMTRLDKVIGGVQYNFFLHSLPHGDEYKHCSQSYHWHLEICPRTSIPTGFELGSGLLVNTITPEVAAQALREVEIE
ncbi:MAG: DUF4931 domain-containing protein [Gammaproteobacteria bacterium]|nr:DUF4931 domain-containing protein [Gammaproteobacteria bacterium]